MVKEVIFQVYFLSLLLRSGSGYFNPGYFNPDLILFCKGFYLLRSESSEAERRNSCRADKCFVQPMHLGFEAAREGADPPVAANSTMEDFPVSCTAGGEAGEVAVVTHVGNDQRLG